MFSGDLASAFAVDYQPLQSVLSTQQWREADRLTTRLLIRVLNLQMGLEPNQLNLSRYSIEQFQMLPCADLNTIDRLWTHYSQGRYGFSVQREIWLSVADLPDVDAHLNKLGSDPIGWLGWCVDVVLDVTGYDSEAGDRFQWDQFVAKVGWQKQGKMTSFDEFFSYPIPRGGLPAMFPRTIETAAWLSLLERVNHC
ncbi:GUN4 domain-containing protein [Aerosakkonemataceae cyanobacterium BLCC-F154]|uniref:GUN4 domain-containing protein n=1 Tax=Floridaenema fluviatile BLCC-F154 TaxID=3153640 RepID=A0ABV4YB70_9CYAN